MCIGMVTQYIERKLVEKSKSHRADLKKLGQYSEEEPLSKQVHILEEKPQLRGMSTIIQDIDTSAEEFVFYFDRLATLLVEHAMNDICFRSKVVETSTGNKYNGLIATGEVSAVVLLRAGGAFEVRFPKIDRPSVTNSTLRLV